MKKDKKDKIPCKNESIKKFIIYRKWAEKHVVLMFDKNATIFWHTNLTFNNKQQDNVKTF